MNNIKLTEKKYFSDRILRRNLDVVRVTDAGIHQWIEIKSYYMPLHIEHDEFHRTFKKVVDVSKAAYFEEIYTGEKIEVVLAFTRAAPTPEAIRKFKDRGIKILILK